MEQVLLLLTDELRPYYRTGDPRLYNLEPPLQLAHLSVRYNDGGQVSQALPFSVAYTHKSQQAT